MTDSLAEHGNTR